MYIVVRTWENGSGLADAMEKHAEDVTKGLSGVPGFVNYYATRSGNTVATVTVCESSEGAKESTRVAGEWVKANVSGAIGSPSIIEGETYLQF